MLGKRRPHDHHEIESRLFLLEVRPHELRLQAAGDRRRMPVRAVVRLRGALRLQRMRVLQHEVLSPPA